MFEDFVGDGEYCFGDLVVVVVGVFDWDFFVVEYVVVGLVGGFELL